MDGSKARPLRSPRCSRRRCTRRRSRPSCSRRFRRRSARSRSPRAAASGRTRRGLTTGRWSMFERRLKIFLGILFGVTAVLLLRSFHLQVFAKSHWQQQATEFAKRPQLVETTRGRILDFRGREIAVDEPCMDACVDYRAVKLDQKWLDELALRRIKQKNWDEYRKLDEPRRRSMLGLET